MLKKYINKFWFTENRKFIIQDNNEVIFQLEYKELLIGTLSFEEGTWIFEYSMDFINQNKIAPIVNFPEKSKKYKSKELWPFFASRVPSAAQLMIDEDQDADIVKMLKEYGKRSITNPFVLEATF